MSLSVETDEALLRRLSEEATVKLSKEDLKKQRVSFVYGNLPNGSAISREMVVDRITENEGA
ncbi:conserved hypothetical protein [Candidatus Defluviicoccus seviourii]|uniref:Uncharacterized protein n=2 Tax=root TaxID=1 RepID=A0A564WED0_9PROT|nr:conserved hypothetical protein [uncultured Defluviicoccus sp.]VUX45874.1 conserved hypothetical protein [Candidatus Defluviicoccus seviourii]